MKFRHTPTKSLEALTLHHSGKTIGKSLPSDIPGALKTSKFIVGCQKSKVAYSFFCRFQVSFLTSFLMKFSKSWPRTAKGIVEKTHKNTPAIRSISCQTNTFAFRAELRFQTSAQAWVVFGTDIIQKCTKLYQIAVYGLNIGQMFVNR